MSSSTSPASSSASSQTAGAGPGKRTLAFVVAAVICLGITAAIDIASRPDPIKEFGRVGEQFYPDFSDPTLAAGLEVYAFDTEEVLPQEFIVKRQPNGRWTIPSRFNYPADADDQLAKTAASVIGIERGAMVTRWPADHARYGVVNPRQDSLKVDEVEGVGKRLILTGDDGSALVDYIIGKQPEDENSSEYYVRHPEEDEVYIATLSIDLSTKFSDWIDTDMLHINQSDIVQIKINDYSFDEIQGTISQGDTSVLTREKSSDPWILADLNEATEEVDADAMREAVSAVADMKIVGVREKQDGLTPDLRFDRSAIRSQNDVARMQQDLLSKGFLLQEDDQPNTLKLIAREGELFASTSDGLVYRLYFGRAFTGSQEELEVGFDNSDGDTESDSDESTDDAGDGGTADEDAGSDTDTAKEEDQESSQPGRYVFVRVEFAESNLGERPTEPTAPEMPAELQAAEDAAADESDEGEESADDTADDEPAEDNEDGDSEEDADAEEDPLAEMRLQWEAAQAKYKSEKGEYELSLMEFEKKVEDGQKKAEDMNRRFADWYYVVPGESFDKLRLSRDKVVKAKEVTEEEKPEAAAANEEASADTPDSPKPTPSDDKTEESDSTETPATTEESTPDASEEGESAPSEETSGDESTDGDSSESSSEPESAADGE